MRSIGISDYYASIFRWPAAALIYISRFRMICRFTAARASKCAALSTLYRDTQVTSLYFSLIYALVICRAEDFGLSLSDGLAATRTHRACALVELSSIYAGDYCLCSLRATFQPKIPAILSLSRDISVVTDKYATDFVRHVTMPRNVLISQRDFEYRSKISRYYCRDTMPSMSRNKLRLRVSTPK